MFESIRNITDCPITFRIIPFHFNDSAEEKFSKQTTDYNHKTAEVDIEIGGSDACQVIFKSYPISQSGNNCFFIYSLRTHILICSQGDSGGPLITYKKITKNGKKEMKAFLIGGKNNKVKGTKSLPLCFVKVQSAEVKAVPITTDQASTPGCQPTFPGLKSMWLRIAASMCSR